jgi:hypothetical protein
MVTSSWSVPDRAARSPDQPDWTVTSRWTDKRGSSHIRRSAGGTLALRHCSWERDGVG